MHGLCVPYFNFPSSGLHLDSQILPDFVRMMLAQFSLNRNARHRHPFHYRRGLNGISPTWHDTFTHRIRAALCIALCSHDLVKTAHAFHSSWYVPHERS